MYYSNNSSITFGSGNNVTGFGQLAITSSVNVILSVKPPQVKAPNDNAIPTVEFYPNPNKGWGYLDISSHYGNGHVTLYLQDIKGKIVYQASEQLKRNNKTSLILNLNALPSGTYILNILFDT